MCKTYPVIPSNRVARRLPYSHGVTRSHTDAWRRGTTPRTWQSAATLRDKADMCNPGVAPRSAYESTLPSSLRGIAHINRYRGRGNYGIGFILCITSAHLVARTPWIPNRREGDNRESGLSRRVIPKSAVPEHNIKPTEYRVIHLYRTPTTTTNYIYIKI